MKNSIYNSIIKVNDSFGLLYNAMSDKFVVLKGEALKNAGENNIDEIKDKDDGLYCQMVEIGGVVDDGVDETEELRSLIKSIDGDDTVFHLHVNPTLDCNFRCWYCYENHLKGSKMEAGMVERVRRLIDNRMSAMKHLKHFQLSFFGGEPLMYFGQVAKPLIEHSESAAAERGVGFSVHFTTNGFLFSDRIFQFLDGKDASFQITLDGGKASHDKTRFCADGRGSYDRIVGNIKRLAEQGHSVILRINYTAANASGINGIVEEFALLPPEAKNRIRIDFQQVWQDSGNWKDAELNVNQCMSKARENGLVVTSGRMVNMVRNSCYGDRLNHLLVNYNGDVFNCTARDFKSQNRSGYLSEDGEFVVENDMVGRRMRAKFSNPACHKCRIAPICAGGCTQKAVEHLGTKSCIFGYKEKDIDKLILDRFVYRYVN